jgi:hypothetical protein
MRPSDQGPQKSQQLKDLEVRKLEMMVQIRKLQAELQDLNLQLYHHGADSAIVMCW